MPNDAKFGLVVGVGLVIAVAVVFFRKDGLVDPAEPAAAVSASEATTSQPDLSNAIISGPSQRGPVEARPMLFTPSGQDEAPAEPEDRKQELPERP